MALSTSPFIMPKSVSKSSPMLFPIFNWILGLLVRTLIRYISSSSGISCGSSERIFLFMVSCPAIVNRCYNLDR